ncbi:MAG: glycosyltransferase family 4 protein [Vicinamibacterales bacterium]
MPATHPSLVPPLRILVLAQYFTPEPITKPGDLAQALSERGHDVTVLTGFPQYPNGVRYPGYALRPWHRDRLGAVPVLRMAGYAYHGRSVLRRCANFAAFAAAAVLARPLLKRPQVIYVWHPPLSIGVAGWLLARLMRVPFVYDVQDIWPDVIVAAGLLQNPRAIRALEALERFIYRRATSILVPNDRARAVLIAKGASPDRLSVTPHWVDGDLARQGTNAERVAARESHGWNDRFVVLFAGNIGIAQDLASVVKAAALVTDSRILLVFAGEGTARRDLENLARDTGVADRTVFLGWRPHPEIPALMAAADALLVHLSDSAVFEAVVPTKTVAYLAAGRPIVMAARGAAADLVHDTETGVVVAPGNPIRLAAALDALARLDAGTRAAMGARGRARFEDTFSKERVVPQYEAALNSVAGK